jgi:hypothetical protein
MPIIQNWDVICLEPLEAAKRVGISITKASQVVRNYYQDFRLKRKFQVRILGRDNSCGHDRQWEDGLNVENMSIGYGGKQSRLRPSLMKQVDGYLGSFNQKLNTGDTQTMVFSANDDGPF